MSTDSHPTLPLASPALRIQQVVRSTNTSNLRYRQFRCLATFSFYHIYSIRLFPLPPLYNFSLLVIVLSEPVTWLALASEAILFPFYFSFGGGLQKRFASFLCFLLLSFSCSKRGIMGLSPLWSC